MALTSECLYVQTLKMLLHARLSKFASLFDPGGIVYVITCIAPGPDEGKRYVGLSIRSLLDRLDKHITAAYFGQRELGPLQQAIASYRPFGRWFKAEIVGEAPTWDALRSLEIATIAELRTHITAGGFNVTHGGEGMCPVDWLATRVEMRIAEWRTDLEGGDNWMLKQISGQYNVDWSAMIDAERNQLLEHHAIKDVCLEPIRKPV